MTISMLAAALMACAASDSTITLEGVNVTGRARHDVQMKSSQTSIQISQDFLQENFSGSLMQTLEGIPGVKAMSIGSGQSKPTIRGLGFNRMAVTEDGIKHEGQQWGDDHGLEIDQFAIDRAEVIKGPAALLYGSDAIGGVLNLYTNHVPTEAFSGQMQLFGRSNNEQIGASAKVEGRQGKFFYRANATYIDYADYSVPTDGVQYYSYRIPLYDRSLRNTAGMERDGSLSLGYAGYNFHTDLRVSDSFSKSGFFANAHGFEVVNLDKSYDDSRRDIDLPYQQVNHLKVISHTTWRTELWALEANLAYQNNLREEHSKAVAHGYMPQPENTLERRFNKSTFTGGLGAQLQPDDHHTLKAGISTEYQHNRRGGWGFVLPDFETFTIGGYCFDRYAVNDGLVLNGGVRYDFARTHIHGYHDWYATPVDGTDTYVERAQALHRHFSSITWSAGVNYAVGEWLLKANVGKSFRVPISKELAANGLNYHIFRYEQGNADLSPEESYQIDAGISWANDVLSVQVDPYLNYFPNYIFLNPSATYVEGLQLYYYTQARVFRYGFEAQMNYTINNHWETAIKGEYLYARQLSGEKKGYSLPFSTPWSVDADVKYSFAWNGKGFAAVNVHVVGAQHEIVPPEKPTDGYFTLNASAGKEFEWGKKVFKVALHANNLLNRRYYDHTSYYRLIDVPEPGRNVAVMVGLEF